MKTKLVLRFLFTVGLFALFGLCARVTVGEASPHALLRVSWSLVGEQITRTLSLEELEKLPIHMRPQDGVIESTPVAYKLGVSIDGEIVADKLVEAAGLKGDRPMYVLEDIALDPGEHKIDITFEPSEQIDGAVRYHLDSQMNFEAGRITVVDLEPGRAELVVR